MLNTNNLFIFTLFKQALGRKSLGGGKAFWFRRCKWQNRIYNKKYNNWNINFLKFLTFLSTILACIHPGKNSTLSSNVHTHCNTENKNHIGM